MWDSPEMFNIYRMLCVVGIIYAVIMIGIWVCIGIMGGPLARFQPPKPPKIPPPPEMPELEKRKVG